MTCTPKDLSKFSNISRTEIGEASVNLEQAVKKVKELIAEKYGDLRLPPESDQILERSLRYKKFDRVQAASHVHLFFKFLSDMHAMHKDNWFLPSIHREYFFESIGFAVLQNRDSKGRTIIYVDYGRLPVANYNLDKVLAACMMLMDQVTRLSVDTQRLGIVYLCQFDGYEFGHAKQFTLARIRLIARLLQGSFPVRYKGFHLVGSPVIFRFTWALFKQFLREKIRSRVYIHGSDLTEFHEQFSPDILPECMGGKLSLEESVDLNFTRQLVANDEYYKELFKYGYMNNAAPDS